MMQKMFTFFSNSRDGERTRRKVYRTGMFWLGSVLPFWVGYGLSRRSTRFGYLLLGRGDFIYPDFLGRYRVHINTQYPSERSMLAERLEQDLSHFIEDYVRPGDVCVDVGANVGAVTLQLAHQVGERGQIHAFEPGHVFFRRLQKNLALNPELEKRTCLYPLGLSETRGELFWEEDPDFPGNAYLFGEKGVPVSVARLDDVLLPKLGRLDFLKIDVEGMEFEVLKGAKALLEKFHPKIVLETLMDFEEYRKKTIRKQTLEWLSSLGYRFYGYQEGDIREVQYPYLPANTLALPS